MIEFSCAFCFRELEKLLSTRYYNMQLLPIKSRSQIFVPLIEMLDNLLVMGVIQSETDIQRLLCLLSPEGLAPSNTASKNQPPPLPKKKKKLHVHVVTFCVYRGPEYLAYF